MDNEQLLNELSTRIKHLEEVVINGSDTRYSLIVTLQNLTMLTNMQDQQIKEQKDDLYKILDTVDKIEDVSLENSAKIEANVLAYLDKVEKSTDIRINRLESSMTAWGNRVIAVILAALGFLATDIYIKLTTPKLIKNDQLVEDITTSMSDEFTINN